PDRVIHRQPDKPAEQKIIVDLLHQLPLGPNREERLQQRRSQQVFWSNRWASRMRIKLFKSTRQCRKHLIHQRPDRPQWVILGDASFQANVRKKFFRSPLIAAHGKSPPSLQTTVS